MQSVHHLNLNMAHSGIGWRGKPDPVGVCGPVPHHPPYTPGGRPVQPVSEIDRIALRVDGRSLPADGSSNGLGSHHIAGQAGDGRGPVEHDDGIGRSGIVVRSTRTGMLSVSYRHQHLAHAYVPGISPPGPAVAVSPAGLVHPEASGGWPAQIEFELQGIAFRIAGHRSPANPASCILRSRPVREQYIHSRRPVWPAQGKGGRLLDIKAVRSGVLAVSYPDLYLIIARSKGSGIPDPDI